MLDLHISLAQPLQLLVTIWGVGQCWQRATACRAVPYLPNEPHKLSLMLHGAVDIKLPWRVCQRWYMPWGKWCAKQTFCKGASLIWSTVPNFSKCSMKSVCVYGISYFSARAFLSQSAGTARQRSWFACMGDLLFNLLCLYRIF